MLKDPDPPRYAARRTKRIYSADTKAELLAACNAPGASVAAVASAHGMNANVLAFHLSRQRIGTGKFIRADFTRILMEIRIHPLALHARP